MGGTSRGRGCALVRSLPSAGSGAGGGAPRRRENSIVWGCEARGPPQTSAVGHREACSPRSPCSPGTLLPSARPISFCCVESIVVLLDLALLAGDSIACRRLDRVVKHL